jgi:hypothetical protein
MSSYLPEGGIKVEVRRYMILGEGVPSGVPSCVTPGKYNY